MSAQKKYQDKEKEEINLDKLIGAGANKEFDRLEIKDFPNLKKLETKNEEEYQKVTKVIISNCEKLEDINDLLSKFPSLTHLDCSSNNLTSLNISNCPEIEKIYCQNNKLTDITLPDKAEKLEVLALLNNDLLKISGQKGLYSLSKFTKLERLYLGNFTNHEDPYLRNYDKDKIGNNTYNKLSGSLKSLQKLKNLKVLDISNTDINSGLKHLLKSSSSIKEIYCSSNKKIEAKKEIDWGVKKVETKLEKDSEFHFANNRYIKKQHDTKEWLKTNYPESETCQNKYDKENYKKNKRKEITKLDISEWGLKGELDLSDFANLKELDCSNNLLDNLVLSEKENKLESLHCQNNKLTSLKLSNLTELKNLDCGHNKLKSLDYLSLKPEKLTCLKISDNIFSKNDLNDFRKFVNLETLHIGGSNSEIIILKEKIKNLKRWLWSNNKNELKEEQELRDIKKCCFSGSLKPLQELVNLEELDISNTDVDRGLEYLPKTCKRLTCIRDDKNPKKSDKIAKAFENYHVSYQGKDYYDLERWEIDADHLLKKTIDIRNNIKKFFDEWDEEEVKELRNPQELENEGSKLDNLKLVGRVVSVTSGALSFAGGALSYDNFSLVGGGISALYPIFEMTYIERLESKYTEKKDKWDEFSKDTKNLRIHYREIISILKPFKFYNYDNYSAEVNEDFKKLRGLLKNENTEKDNEG